ncbi:MAG: hypothetical protein QMB51_02300 [Patescibacteria group bacterium]
MFYNNINQLNKSNPSSFTNTDIEDQDYYKIKRSENEANTTPEIAGKTEYIGNTIAAFATNFNKNFKAFFLIISFAGYVIISFSGHLSLFEYLFFLLILFILNFSYDKLSNKENEVKKLKRISTIFNIIILIIFISIIYFLITHNLWGIFYRNIEAFISIIKK